MTTELAAAPLETYLDFISHPTPQLRATLAHHEATLPAAEFADLLSYVRSAFAKYTAKLLEFRPGRSRGSALHEMMDRELKAAAGQPVSCKEGCSGCCHYEVEITNDEAEILKIIVQEGFPIDRAKLDEQASRERKSTAWTRFWHPQNRCVFLGANGGCQIYEDRPAICRKHLVVTPASACTTPGGAVAPVQVLMAEILLSAAISLDGATFASLPKMLRAALVADERGKARGIRTSLPPARAVPSSRTVAPEVFATPPPRE